jgi:excisionase family DNA binding protein
MTTLSGLIDPRRVYSLSEVSDILRVSRVTLNRAAQKGTLKAIRVGKLWRVQGREIARFVQSGGSPPAEDSQA